VFTSNNGDKYYGQWRHGEKHGFGTHVWGDFADNGAEFAHYFSAPWRQKAAGGDATGERYAGQWSYGKKHGLGTYTWSDGDVFEGQWEHGKKVVKEETLATVFAGLTGQLSHMAARAWVGLGLGADEQQDPAALLWGAREISDFWGAQEISNSASAKEEQQEHPPGSKKIVDL
jgi:hypothetical protein